MSTLMPATPSNELNQTSSKAPEAEATGSEAYSPPAIRDAIEMKDMKLQVEGEAAIDEAKAAQAARLAKAEAVGSQVSSP